MLRWARGQKHWSLFGTLMERFIRLSIRVHWIPFVAALLFQYYIGATVIADQPFIALPKISLPFTGQQLFDAHVIVGNTLVIAAAVLTLEKMAVLFFPIRRTPIPNSFVRGHIEGHFIGLSIQLMIQWISMNAPEEVTFFLKENVGIHLPPNYWKQIHAVNALIMVGIAVILAFERFYVSGLRAVKTEKPKSS